MSHRNGPVRVLDADRIGVQCCSSGAEHVLDYDSACVLYDALGTALNVIDGSYDTGVAGEKACMEAAE